MPILFLHHRQLDEIGQFRLAQTDGTGVETARIAAIVHADGNHVVLVPSDQFRLHQVAPGRLPLADESRRVTGVGAGFSHQGTVQESLVRIVDGAEVQHDPVRAPLLQGGRNHQMDPVPGVSVRILDSLQRPILLQRKDLPVAVIESGLTPGGIVPLPETAFLHGDLRRYQDRASQRQRDHQQKLFHNQVVYQFITSPV